MSLIGELMNLLVQSSVQGGQLTGNQDAMSQMIGGLLGGSSGSGQAGQVLGALEQMISNGNQGGVQNTNMAANNPMLNLVQPIAEQLSQRTGLEPQQAQAVVSLALHRMLASHPSFGGSNARMNLAEVLQQMAASGGVNQAVLHNSGMVNDLVNASGMDKQAALQNLSEVFGLLSGHVQNASGR